MISKKQRKSSRYRNIHRHVHHHYKYHSPVIKKSLLNRMTDFLASRFGKFFNFRKRYDA